MGNKLQNQLSSAPNEGDKFDIDNSRFLRAPASEEKDLAAHSKIIIPEFKRLEDWQLELQQIKAPEEARNILVSLVAFRERQAADLYLGTLLALKQLCDISVYQELDIKTQKDCHCVITKQILPGQFQQVKKSHLSGKNTNKFLDLLIFVSKLISNTENLYVTPEQLFCCNGQFFLRSFSFKKYNKSRLLLSYITWLYEQFQSFKDIVQQETVISFVDFDIYLREVYMALKAEKVPSDSYVRYFQQVKNRYNYLNYNFDSFHACCKAKKIKLKALGAKEWLVAKKANQVYFFNIKDRHMCQGRIIRKKNKIMVEHVHLMFNMEQLQVDFFLEGTKNIVKTSQFQLQDCFTISDIEIKYKLPLKLKNPMVFRRNQQIYLYDQLIYRYSIDQNKLYQESKKINDCIFLTQSLEHNYLLIRISIDIFRYGIRVYYADQYEVIYPSGNPDIAEELQNIKIDIKHVQFCIEVYKGVYLMLANQNLWILDLNFGCFFSYTPIDRLKAYTKTKLSQLSNQQQQSDFAFHIIDQPFSVKLLPFQDNLNVAIENEHLHIIGNVMGKMYYLQYQFILEAGMLRLKHCQPLFSETKRTPQIEELVAQHVDKKKPFSFNIYTEHFEYFKTNKWVYHGPSFLQVSSLKAITNKAHTQIQLQTEPILGSLKQLIELKKQNSSQRWSKNHLKMLLHTITNIFNEISKQGINHKNFSINNLIITQKKKLKLVGWSEPHRNWYISDYRDYLLVCFNIITLNVSEKITDKLMEKHQSQLSNFPALRQKMIYCLKHKLPEKKTDQDKHMITIRESLNKYIFPLFQSYRSANHIFAFEYNTPRFSCLSIQDNKIKKMIAVIEGGHNAQEFTFKVTDKYVWNAQKRQLYIFTANYQMLEASINIQDFKQETITLQEYEYLPQNIVDCNFIHTPKGLFAIGGVSRCSKKDVLYNDKIYHFQSQKLTWMPVADLPGPRLQPKLVLSSSGSYIHIMGGELDGGSQNFCVLKFDTTSYQIQNLIDYGMKNLFRTISPKHTHMIFNVSEEQSIFLLWMANSTNYQFRIFSNLTCGLQVELQGKIYLQEYGQMPPVAISLVQGAICFLRPYGKYTKIAISNLQQASVAHKTLYAN